MISDISKSTCTQSCQFVQFFFVFQFNLYTVMEVTLEKRSGDDVVLLTLPGKMVLSITACK